MASNRDYFKAICRVSSAFGKAMRKAELLNLIVDSAIDTMAGKAACLFLADEEKDVFVPVAQRGLSDDYMHAAPERAKQMVTDLVKNGYLAIADAAQDKNSENHDAKKAEGIASILVVPVMIDNKAVGVLTLYTADPRQFSEDDIAFLSALAEQGGVALDRGRLIGQIRNSTKMFFDLSTSINASLDVKEIMETLTVDLSRTLKAKAVSVQLIDEGSGELRRVASLGLSDKYLAKGAVEDDPHIKAALEGRTVLIKNVADENTVLYRDEKIAEGIVTILTVPVKSKDDLIGIIQLYYAVQKDFYDDEIMMVNALANQAGLAIQNATCYLALENDMKDLKDDIWSHRSYF